MTITPDSGSPERYFVGFGLRRVIWQTLAQLNNVEIFLFPVGAGKKLRSNFSLSGNKAIVPPCIPADGEYVAGRSPDDPLLHGVIHGQRRPTHRRDVVIGH